MLRVSIQIGTDFTKRSNVICKHKHTSISSVAKNETMDAYIKKSYRDYMKSRRGNFENFSELCASAELYGFTGYVFQLTQVDDFEFYAFGITGNTVIVKKKPASILVAASI